MQLDYRIVAALGPTAVAPAPLTRAPFVDASVDSGTVVLNARTDHGGFYTAPFVLRELDTAWRAGYSFDAALEAARQLTTHEAGSVALLQAADGAYYLARPSLAGDDPLPLELDSYDGTEVRSNTPTIHAVVDGDQWVDLRT